MSEVPARPASTILLLRDGPTGLEVLMVERNVASEFASGALVFPGGRVDAADGTHEQGLRVAGIRETWEEARLLLARRRNATRLINARELEALEQQLDAKLGRAADFADFVASGEIELATDLMVRFSHWITPAGRPKRYDTHFYLAPMPSDQKPGRNGTGMPSDPEVRPRSRLAAISSTCESAMVAITK